VKIDAPSFAWLGNGELFGIPNPILLMILLYIVAHVVMTRTSFGRYIYAVGGNPEAARLSGVPVFTVLILVYAICGAMAGLGGIVDASRFEGGRPNAGEMYELQVIAAVVVGGTSLAGGEGRVFGTLIGALIMAVIQNGLNMAGVKSYEQKVVFGLLILAAVLLDQLKKQSWRLARQRR
jgi:ribose transport system permease protein